MKLKWLYISLALLGVGMSAFFVIRPSLKGSEETVHDNSSEKQENATQEKEIQPEIAQDIPAEPENNNGDKVEESQPESTDVSVLEKESAKIEQKQSIIQKTEEGAMEKVESEKVAQKSESTDSKGLSIREKLVSFGYAVPEKVRSIDTIVLHSSYDAIGDDPYSVNGVISEWKDYGVAPHYLIARDGIAYRLVADKNIAYHAGVSEVPDGRSNVNDFSIGVEILNTKTDDYTDAQYKAINNLIASLKEKYKIKYVLGHDEIAPGRKTDPWNIDWREIKK